MTPPCRLARVAVCSEDVAAHEIWQLPVGQVLARGLWKPNGDEETEMQINQRKRSLVLKDRIGA